MAVWSSLRANVTSLFKGSFKGAPNQMRLMSGDHKTMPIRASNFQWNKTKDLLHFYVLLGLIPISCLIFYVNVFIGPAKLKEIPADYTPKHWEYYRHPITRFLARYIYPPPQEHYEKFLHHLYEEDEKMKIRKLQQQIMDLMAERKDYQAYYYVPVDGKYHRIIRKETEEIAEVGGWIPPTNGPV